MTCLNQGLTAVELRRRNYLTPVAAQVKLNGMNQREQDPIKKTAAGMLKLLYPQFSPGEVPKNVLDSVVAFAVEMRKRVIDQMAVMKPAEFQEVCFECKVNTPE